MTLIESIMGWIDDVGAVGQDYALTGTFLWIGIMAGEPIVSSLVVKSESRADS